MKTIENNAEHFLNRSNSMAFSNILVEPTKSQIKFVVNLLTCLFTCIISHQLYIFSFHWCHGCSVLCHSAISCLNPWTFVEFNNVWNINIQSKTFIAPGLAQCSDGPPWYCKYLSLASSHQLLLMGCRIKILVSVPKMPPLKNFSVIVRQQKYAK